MMTTEGEDTYGATLPSSTSSLPSGFSFYGISPQKCSRRGSLYYRRPGSIVARCAAGWRSLLDAVKRFRKLRAINDQLNRHARQCDDGEEHDAVWHEEWDIGEIQQQTYISQSPLFRAVSTNDVEQLDAILEAYESKGPGGCVRRKSAGDLLQQRSPNGTTPLHIAVLYNCRDVMLRLLECSPALVDIPQKGLTTSMYDGQHALHLAVANRNFTLVKDLVERNATFGQSVRATGPFFRPSDESSVLYWGEHVVAFAACSGQMDVVKYLVEHGADLTVQDAEKNNILHLLCQAPASAEEAKAKAEMILFVLDLASSDDQKILLGTKNVYSWTPLKMAAYQGAVEPFKVLVDFKRSTHWNYGPVTSCVYSLNELDTFNDSNSVLDLVIQSPSQKRYKLVQTAPISQLLTEKWRDFVRFYFFIWAVLYIIMLAILTCVVCYRPTDLSLCQVPGNSTSGNQSVLITEPCRPLMPKSTYDGAYSSAGDFVRLVGELFVVAWAAVSLYIEAVEFWHSKLLGRKYDTAVGGYNTLAVVFDLAVMSTAIMRLMDARHQEVAMSCALLFGYMYVLNFARALPSLGPYVAMITKMLFGDVVRFLSILCVFVIPYALVASLLTKGSMVEVKAHSTFYRSLSNSFHIAVGNSGIDLDHIEASPNFIFFGIVADTYVVIATVLLLNLLIAMMSNTYQEIRDHQYDVWNHQMASLVLFLEGRLPHFLNIRSGFPGSSLGLKNDSRWYLRVQDQRSWEKNDRQDRPRQPLTPLLTPSAPDRWTTLCRRLLTRQTSILSQLSPSLVAGAGKAFGHGLTDGSGGTERGQATADDTRKSDRKARFFSFPSLDTQPGLQPGRSLSVIIPSISLPPGLSRRTSDLHSLPAGAANFFDEQTASLMSDLNATSQSTINESDYEEPWAGGTTSDSASPSDSATARRDGGGDAEHHDPSDRQQHAAASVFEISV